MDQSSDETEDSKNVFNARIDSTLFSGLGRVRNFRSHLGSNIISKIIPRKFGVNIQVYDEKNNFNVVKVSVFSIVLHLKVDIARKIKHDEPKHIRLFYRNYELLDPDKMLYYYGVKNRSKVFYIAKKVPSKAIKAKTQKKKLVKFFGCVPRTRATKKLLSDVTGGLKKGFAPELALDGTGGGYFLCDKNKKKCAIFKPADEEPFAPNNPRVYISSFGTRGFRPGLYSGGGATREVAAFMLDRGGYSGVPVTTMAEVVNVRGFKYDSRRQTQMSKIGSLQRLAVEAYESSGDYGTRRFDVEEVHKIGILDIHIVNLDRNDENILINERKGNSYLDFVPIDHGYCLPSSLYVESYDWVWYSWPQAKMPFSKRSLDYIRSINIEKDVEMLRSLGIEEEAILVFKIVNILFKKAANAGLTLYQIAKIILRKSKNEPSKLEIIIVIAMALYFQNSKKNFESTKSITLSSNNSRPTSRSVATAGLLPLPQHMTQSQEREMSSSDDSRNSSQTHLQQPVRHKSVPSLSQQQPKRNLSQMDLHRKIKCGENCFAAPRKLMWPCKSDWRDNSHLEIPQRFAENLWLSKCTKLAMNSMFLARTEALMEFAIHESVLANKKRVMVV